MGAVPGMLNLTHMGDQFSHLLYVQCSSNHHLKVNAKKKKKKKVMGIQHNLLSHVSCGISSIVPSVKMV